MSPTPLQIGIEIKDPRRGGAPLAWTARVEFYERDIMVIQDGMPFLADLPAVAERHGKWVPSEVVGSDLREYADDAHRSSDRLEITRDNDLHPELRTYDMMLKELECGFVQVYQGHTNASAKVDHSSGYDLLRYQPGGRFGCHVDAVHNHPVLGHRRLSVVAFCNAGVEGGALNFPRQGITVYPDAGTVVIFPSGFTHPHEAMPVLAGVKYSAVAWFF